MIVRLAWLIAAAAEWTAAALAARHGVSAGVVNTIYATAIAASYLALWALAGEWGDNRRRTFAAISVTLVMVLGVVVLEGVAAWRHIDFRLVRAALTHAEGPNDFSDDPVLSFRRPPHVHWSGWPLTDMAAYFNLPIRIDHPMTFSTDAKGFRNSTDLTHTDIALVGDSYVEGWTLSDDETIAAQVAARTHAPVANLGTAGYGSLQELQVLERYALPLGPRFVGWFFFEGNDLDDDQVFENAMTTKSGVDAGPAATREPLAHRWRSFVDRSFTWNSLLELRRLTDRVVPNAIDTFGWFRDADGVEHKMYFYDFYATRQIGDFERERLKVTVSTLQRAAEDCRRHGTTLVVYYVPIKFRVYRDAVTFPSGSPCEKWTSWDLESQVRAACERAHIPFTSLTEPMRQAAHRGALLYEAADSHWNAAGAAFVADIVVKDARE
jgi:hypothetical protein